MSFFSKGKKRIKKLNAAYIRRKCGFTAICFREITSTNAILKEYALQNAPEWTAVIAESQTEGKGRGDHSFYSPLGSGIYISILLRPKNKRLNPADITAAAGVAACEAIESLSERGCAIKWMNDVFIEGRKVAGILAESAVWEGERFVVVGAGFNLTTPEGGYPEEIAGTAASILGEDNRPFLREKMAIAFFAKLQEMMKAPSDEVFRAYKERLFLIGKTVLWQGREVRVSGLASDYRLEITTEDGEKQFLDSGEVSLSSKSFAE